MSISQTTEFTPSWLHIWLQAARPKTLWASIAPVTIGTAMAWGDGVSHWPAAFAALLGAMSIQIATNFCNDYADFKKGADTAERLGPVRATAAGWVRPQTMLRATVLLFSIAALLALYLVVRGGWPILIIAVLAILFGVLYTVGPYALAYRGWSEIFVFIFFGPIAVGGTYYVQAQEWPWIATVAGFAPGLLSCALLTVNNIRDVEQDRRADKRTLAVRFGKPFARGIYAAYVLSALGGLPFLLFFREGTAVWTFLIPLSAVLGAIRPVRAMLGGLEGVALNDVLARTGKLLLLQAALFSVGWMLR